MNVRSNALLSLAALLLCVASIQVAIAQNAGAATPGSEQFSHLTFTPPAGWTRSTPSGWLVFSAPNLPAGQYATIGLSPGGPSSRGLAEEFAALVQVSANGQTIVQADNVMSQVGPQGTTVMSQHVTYKDANGNQPDRLYLAQRNGDRFEAMVYSASSHETGAKYLKEFGAIVNGGVYGTGAAAPTPAPAPAATPPQSANRPPAAVQATPAAAAKPFQIVGHAVFDDGRPVPQFHVHAAGFNGKFNPALNNNLEGPQVRQGATTYGDTDGAGGSYVLGMKESALIFGVIATAGFDFHGKHFNLDMWPTDNKADDTSAGGFRGYTDKGIVRDFVLKMEGIRPGFNPAEYPDAVSDQPTAGAHNSYYGGTIDGDNAQSDTESDYGGYKTALFLVYPKGSTITVTLTPTGPLVTGQTGKVVRRSMQLGRNFFLFGVPYGSYSASAQLTEPGGASHALKVATHDSPGFRDFVSSAALEWSPFHANSGDYMIHAKLFLAK